MLSPKQTMRGLASSEATEGEDGDAAAADATEETCELRPESFFPASGEHPLAAPAITVTIRIKPSLCTSTF